MAKAKTPDYDSIAASLMPAETPSTTRPTEELKPRQLNSLVDGELLKKLERVVFWRKFELGQKDGNANQRAVVQDALRLLFENDENSKRLMPNEK